jgi:hypothetical protein
VRRDEFVGAFVELVPGYEDQFNLVRAIPDDAQGNVLGSTEAVALSEVEFSARLRLPDGPSVTLGDLSVSL